MKTAVEQLEDEFIAIGIYKSNLKKLIDKAKELEKQQIMDATCLGEYVNVDDRDIAERYYNETYKK